MEETTTPRTDAAQRLSDKFGTDFLESPSRTMADLDVYLKTHVKPPDGWDTARQLEIELGKLIRAVEHLPVWTPELRASQRGQDVLNQLDALRPGQSSALELGRCFRRPPIISMLMAVGG